MGEDRAPLAADQAALEAVEWFVRLQGDAATGDEWLAFEAWLTAAAGNAAAYERSETLWVALDDARVPWRAIKASARRTLAGRPAPRMSRRRWLAATAALAASIAVAVIVTRDLAPAPAQTWRTAAGETRVLDLADGTHVRLNANSRLSIALGRHDRRVEMAEGEAAFDVAHDPRRPFLVTVGDRKVRVVGTEFNIRRRDGAMALTVRRGVVEVQPAEQSTELATRLTAGEQLLHHDGDVASTISTVEPGIAFAWTDGQLIYQDAPMSDVAADLSRRFGVPVRVADADTGRVRFTGVLVTDSVSGVLRRIEAFAPVAVARSSDGFVLTRRPKAR